MDEMNEVLLKEKEEIEEKLGRTAVKNPHNKNITEAAFPEYGDDEDDNAHEIEEYIVNQETEEILEKKLRDVNAALGRIKDGTYGICKYTGEPIGEARLRARPTSSTSAEYKERLQNT